MAGKFKPAPWLNRGSDTRPPATRCHRAASSTSCNATYHSDSPTRQKLAARWIVNSHFPASTRHQQLSRLQLHRFVGQLETAVIQGGGGGELPGAGIVDLRAAQVPVPAARIGAACNQHSSVGQQTSRVFRACRTQTAGLRESTPLRVVQFGARYDVVPIAARNEDAPVIEQRCRVRDARMCMEPIPWNESVFEWKISAEAQGFVITSFPTNDSHISVCNQRCTGPPALDGHFGDRCELASARVIQLRRIHAIPAQPPSSDQHFS